MAGKKRKKGDWITVVASRKNKNRELLNGKGHSGIPVNETGSAAYRRLQRRLGSQGKY